MSPPVRLWRAVLIVVAVVAAAALAGSAFNFYSQRTESSRIRKSQLDSCVQVGDPIQTALIQLVRDQIAASENVKPSLFPNIPRREFERLVNEQQTNRLRVLAKLRRVPTCEQRFGN